MLDKSKISKLGVGTWGVGGYMEKDTSVDTVEQAEGIAYAIDKGMNFAEANYWYSEGYSVEILTDGIKRSGKKREDLFLCQAIYVKENKPLEVSIKEIDKVLDTMGTDYIDTLQFSMESFRVVGFEKIVDFVQDLLNKKVIRYTSITNSNLEILKRYHKLFGDQLLSHEVCLNFEVRANEDAGIVPYMKDNGIMTVVYQPLRRNRTAQRNWPLLVELAKKYGKTQNQIILNWLSHMGYTVLVKSQNKKHLDENLESLNFTMDSEDYKKIDEYRVPGYIEPKINWYDKNGDGITIDQLSNIFDEEYDKQQNTK